MFYVYKITNKINGKLYIGFTHNIDYRWRRHVNTANSKSDKYKYAIHHAIVKYYKENFTIEEIYCNADKQACVDMEIFFIKEYDSLVPKGYNLTIGGENPVCSEETRRKISIANTGKKHSDESKAILSYKRIGDKNPFYNKKHTQESINKISAALTGENNHFYGKVHTEESRMKISKTHSGKKLDPFTPERCKNISLSKIGKKTGPQTPEHRKKISDSNKKSMTKELRQKLSNMNVGDKNRFYGKHHSEETKKLLSESKLKIDKSNFEFIQFLYDVVGWKMNVLAKDWNVSESVIRRIVKGYYIK